MNNLKSKIISLAKGWKARSISENDFLFQETSDILFELAETMEGDLPEGKTFGEFFGDRMAIEGEVVSKNNSPYPSDYYIELHPVLKNTIIKWTGYPCGAIKNSSVKHEMIDEDGNRIVTSFSGKNYNVHPAVRECSLDDGSSYYIREGCFPIRWEIEND